ncbi:MAG TPA: hypothetical protein DCL84_06835 [Eubacterium sp.]|nr:hypothetical protein [Eubacterium sp.]
MRETYRNNNKGFSLVELIIVISIMAVLLGVITPALIRYLQKSRIIRDERNLDIVRESIETVLSNEDFYEDLADSSVVINEDGTIAINNTKISSEEKTKVTKELTDVLNNNKIEMSSFRYKSKKIIFKVIDGVVSEPEVEK